MSDNKIQRSFELAIYVALFLVCMMSLIEVVSLRQRLIDQVIVAEGFAETNRSLIETNRGLIEANEVLIRVNNRLRIGAAQVEPPARWEEGVWDNWAIIVHSEKYTPRVGAVVYWFLVCTGRGDCHDLWSD